MGFPCIQNWIVLNMDFQKLDERYELMFVHRTLNISLLYKRFLSPWILLSFCKNLIVRAWILQNVSSKSIQMYFTIVLVWNQNGYGGVLVCMYVCLFMAVCDECGLYVKMSVCSKCPMYSLPCYPHLFLPTRFPSRFSIGPCQI